MCHHGANVSLQDRRQLSRSITTLLHPLWNLVVPDQCVSADDHVVALRERDQRVATCEIIGIRVRIGSRMNGAELHLVLGLKLAEFRAKDRGVLSFA